MGPPTVKMEGKKKTYSNSYSLIMIAILSFDFCEGIKTIFPCQNTKNGQFGLFLSIIITQNILPGQQKSGSKRSFIFFFNNNKGVLLTISVKLRSLGLLSCRLSISPHCNTSNSNDQLISKLYRSLIILIDDLFIDG